jgi:acyl carrier protein
MEPQANGGDPTRDDIVQRIHRLMMEMFEIPQERLRPDATLYEELELDSLDSVDLVVALEKEFGLKIVRESDEKTIGAMRLMSDIYEFVQAKLASAAV